MHKKNILLIYAITMLTLLVTGSTYAFLSISKSNNSYNGVGGCFTINYNVNQNSTYNNTNTILKSSSNYGEEYGGGSSNYAQVTVSENTECKIYKNVSINLHTNAETSLTLVKEGALKYRVVANNFSGTDGTNNTTDQCCNECQGSSCTSNWTCSGSSTPEQVGCWKGSIKVANPETATSSVLDSPMATFNLSTTAKSFKIYLWVDETVTSNSNYVGDYDGLIYSGYVYADAIQSSTIK